jgi:hypothetical protein
MRCRSSAVCVGVSGVEASSEDSVVSRLVSGFDGAGATKSAGVGGVVGRSGKPSCAMCQP